MKKNLIVVLIIAIICSGMAFAATTASGSISGDGKIGSASPADPTLNINWSLNLAKETYELGFTTDSVIQQGRMTPATALTLENVRDTTSYVGKGSTYVYWKIFTIHPLKITMSGSGPLHTSDGTPSGNNQDINWTATWTPKKYMSNGQIMEDGDGAISIGSVDLSVYSPDDYAEKKIFTILPADADKGEGQKNDIVKIDVVTQNVLDQEKENGDYAATLTLKVAPQA